MMHGPEKSDPGIVAMKPANKTEQSVAEPVERRAGTKGNADQQSTCRDQSRISVSQAMERIRKVQTLCRHTPEVGAVCGKAARTVLCGGRSAMSVPTASQFRAFTLDRCDAHSTSATGQSLHIHGLHATSALPPIATKLPTKLPHRNEPCLGGSIVPQ